MCVSASCTNRTWDANECGVDCGGTSGCGDCAALRPSKGCGETNGGFNYCGNPNDPCDEGEGDCHNDSTKCAPGLVCRVAAGPYFGLAKGKDVCVRASCAIRPPWEPWDANRCGKLDASVVAYTFPAEMIGGQTYPVSITMKNTGEGVWTGSTFALGVTTNPPDGWGITNLPLGEGETVRPNETHTFAFSMTPHGYRGPFSVGWRMRNSEISFGQELQVSTLIDSACPDGADSNGCGGCAVLPSAPNSACGACGKIVCNADKNSVSCDDPGYAKPVQVTTGERFSCVRFSTGGVRCWGDNQYGQLGDGTFTSRTTPSAPTLPGFSYIAAGNSHICGVTQNRTIKCWGQGGSGQIGDGTSFNRAIPVIVPGLSDVAQLDVGRAHTCVRIGTTDVYCWGGNDHDQLGNGSTNNSLVPYHVMPDLLSQRRPITAIAAGGSHTCALTNGELWCWGWNANGQLGSMFGQIEPVANVTALSAGEDNTCALIGDGSVKCWGYTCTLESDDGYLRSCRGDSVGGELGNWRWGATPAPVDIVGLSKPAKSIVVGNAVFCAVLTDDSVQCWGANNRGQLGVGDTNNHFLPVTVPGLSGVFSVDNKWTTTCAVFGAGKVACWGDNRFGQIGDGTFINRTVPTPVLGLDKVCQ